MNRTDVERDLLEVFSAVLGHPVDTTLTRINEPGWDSLKHMQIIFAVEEKFGVQFTEEEIPGLDSFGKFAGQLERRHAA
jgi:acyl carrier protein